MHIDPIGALPLVIDLLFSVIATTKRPARVPRSTMKYTFTFAIAGTPGESAV